MANQDSTLRRTLSWKTFGLYGLGNILGAGIYVLIGEVAAESGNGLLWSFLLASVVAMFTAITYSALASEYPISAGAAIYVRRAFSLDKLSLIVGLALAFTGIVSAGVLLKGFDRYFQELLNDTFLSGLIPHVIVIATMLSIFGYIAYRGIKESAALAVILTVLEVSGILLIIVLGAVKGDVGHAISISGESLGSVEPLTILLGAFLAFYAFIGFEDMVNVAEEVKTPKTSIKRGMFLAITLATLLYFATVIASLAVLSSQELAESKAPLAKVFEVSTGSTVPVLTIIGLFAIINGVLVQIIMSSRILYGLSREKLLHARFGRISDKHKTPSFSTIFIVLVILVTTLLLPISTLAQMTSFGLLTIFSIVHLSALKLIRDKKVKLNPLIPILGFTTNIALIIMQILDWLGKV